MGREDRLEPGWHPVSTPRRDDQAAPVQSGNRRHEGTGHGQGSFANGEHVKRNVRRGGKDAPGQRPVHEQGRVGPGNRGGYDEPEIGAKRRERSGQWAFAGSDQADNPVSTSISRRRRLTTCSPFCCAHS